MEVTLLLITASEAFSCCLLLTGKAFLLLFEENGTAHFKNCRTFANR